MTISSEISALRHYIRRLIRARRRALSNIQQAYFARLAAARMITHPPVVIARTVALFLSFDGELDTQPLIDQLWRAGKRVYLPAVYSFEFGKLVFLHYHRQSELIVTHLNIREPKLNLCDILPVNQIDVIITPLVAFDKKGHRLGMGGGFYDRTLQRWRQHRLRPIGYAHDCQAVDKIPVKTWDVPLSTIITPSKVLRW